MFEDRYELASCYDDNKLFFTYVKWWPSRIPSKIEKICNLQSLPDLLVAKSAMSK